MACDKSLVSHVTTAEKGMAGSRVIVLGGGISGLAASWRIATSHHGAQVTLIEASNRTGGWIQSYKSPNGAIFEAGPRSLRVAGNAARSTMGLVSWQAGRSRALNMRL